MIFPISAAINRSAVMGKIIMEFAYQIVAPGTAIRDGRQTNPICTVDIDWNFDIDVKSTK